MGGKLVNSESPVHQSFTEAFYKVFPFFLSIGMTADQFWEEDVYLAKYYRQAYDMQQERSNQQAWLNGLYVYNALSVVAQNIFRKKGDQPKQYIDKPIRITPLSAEEKKELAEKQRQEAVAYFNSWLPKELREGSEQNAGH